MNESYEKAPALLCEGLVKRYAEGERPVEVLRGVSLRVMPGETVAILGASGSGKSTLLHALGGLDDIDEGRVVVAGTELVGLSDKARGRLRNEKLGFVYQFHHLLPEFSALDNAAMPLLIRREEPSEARRRAAVVLSELGLGDRLEHLPAQLSGGERQRVAIARALVTSPRCVLADEPTGNLDSKSGKIVIDALNRINREFGKTIVMVTHDPQMASNCSRIILLKDGVILDTLNRGDNQEKFYQEIIGRMADL